MSTCKTRWLNWFGTCKYVCPLDRWDDYIDSGHDKMYDDMWDKMIILTRDM